MNLLLGITGSVAAKLTPKLIKKKVIRLELNTTDIFVPIKVVTKNLSGFKMKS